MARSVKSRRPGSGGAWGGEAAAAGASVVDKQAAAGGALTEIGTTGLAVYGGAVADEFLPELSGRKALKVYRRMAHNDPVIGSVLFAISMLLRQMKWSVEPASEDERDADAAEFLESCRQDMSVAWPDLIAEVLSMLWAGFHVAEIVYKRRLGPSEDPTRDSAFNDGLVGWRKLAPRAQETIDRWDIDESDGGIRGLTQVAPPRHVPVYIPIEKLLLFRTTIDKGNPEGRSVLRTAYEPWWFVQNLRRIEAIGVERDLAGLPVAWVPQRMLRNNATADEQQTLAAVRRAVTQVRNNEQGALVLPLAWDERGNKLFEFGLLSTGGRRNFDTGAIIQRYRQEEALTVLADFVLLGHEKVGSFALTDSKTEIFATALGAWADSIAAVFNRYAVPRLFRLNPKFRVEALPQIVHGDVEKPDLERLGEYISKLAAAGMPLFPDEELERRLRSAANLPPPPVPEAE